MPLWGNVDRANNAVISAAAQFNKTPNTSNRDSLYGNNTADAFTSREIIGMYGVDTTEVGVSGGPLVNIVVTSPGSGYSANTTVTVGGNGTANATSNASGRISSVNISDNGSGYTANPTVTIAAPSAQTFAGNTTAVEVGNTTNTGWISLGSNRAFFVNNDIVTYLVAASNTALGGLTNNVSYYVSTINSTALQLKVSPGATSAVNISSVPTSAQAGHSLTGETATAVASIGGGENKGIAHAGWVIRTEGTGGRAGRVQYETLVAMGSMTSDGSDDNPLPDA